MRGAEYGVITVKLALLTELSWSAENINSCLLQSGPESFGGSSGGQEAFQCVHHRVTARLIGASIIPFGSGPSGHFREQGKD